MARVASERKRARIAAYRVCGVGSMAVSLMTTPAMHIWAVTVGND